MHLAGDFQRVYGRPPAWLVRAPGRANLIGGHTDYNEGYTLPLAIDRAIYLAAFERLDGQIYVHSLDFDAPTAEFAADDFHNAKIPHWARYIAGAWWLLAELGVSPMPGAEIIIASDLPRGAGMSSSAAMGVGAVELALTLASMTANQPEKARLAQRIENEFIGMPSGILDQMASATALPDSAMLLDCRTYETQPVPLPSELAVWVIDSKKPRELAASGYAERRTQCEEAARLMAVPALRDATPEMLEGAREALGPLRYQRARHIITENARVLAMREALQADDRPTAYALLNTAHASLRDDYAISIPEINFLCARIAAAGFGARIMGGGFGGSVVALVEAARVETLTAEVLSAYADRFGLAAEGFICHPAPGSACWAYHE